MMVQRGALACFAHGKQGEWEAICIDLDIAVHGSSLIEVQNLLSDAITTYFQDVAGLDESNRERLLNRRAPLYVRIGYVLRFVIHLLRGRRQGGDHADLKAGFDVPCPA